MQNSLFPILHKYYYDNMYIAILLKKENKKINAFVVITLPSTEKTSEKEIV